MRIKTRNALLYCLLILLFAGGTAIAGHKNGKGNPKRNMQQVISKACEKDPYGPKCIGNLDAHSNYERAYRDHDRYDDNHPCGYDNCNDGWSEDWRH